MPSRRKDRTISTLCVSKPPLSNSIVSNLFLVEFYLDRDVAGIQLPIRVPNGGGFQTIAVRFLTWTWPTTNLHCDVRSCTMASSKANYATKPIVQRSADGRKSKMTSKTQLEVRLVRNWSEGGKVVGTKADDTRVDARIRGRETKVVRAAAERQPKEWLKKAVSAISAGALAMSVTASGPVLEPAQAAAPMEVMQLAKLTAGDPQKNPNALLRNALPIDNKPIRAIQQNLELISEDLRVPGVNFRGVSSKVNASYRVATKNKDKILADVAEDKKAAAEDSMAKLVKGLEALQETVKVQDKQEVPLLQQELLRYVGDIEQDMVKGFPFEIPQEYSNLPALKGRATITMDLTLKDNPVTDKAKMVIVVDGYNAPITAGNFVDLVNKKLYDGMEIQRADGFVVQTGKPEDGDGFKIGGKLQTIPLEVKVPADEVPLYGETLENLGRFQETPVLPFNAFGTLAMARSEFEPNSASSQIFWLLKESELTPSSANLLDGSYGVFGYVVQGADILQDLKVGDVITSAKVVAGQENLVNPRKGSSPSAPPPAAEE